MTNSTFLALFCTFVVTFITGCQPNPPYEPMCRATHTSITHDGDFGACVIRVKHQLLALQNEQSFQLSVAQKRSTESLACAAHRGIWETMGINLEVGEPLRYDPINNVQLFDCHLMESTLPNTVPYATPNWSKASSHSIVLIDPYTLDDKQWGTHVSPLLLRDSFNVATDNPR